MFKGAIQNHLNVNGTALCPPHLQKALVLSGLTWGVPRAQYYAMQMWGFRNLTTTFVSELKERTCKTVLNAPSTQLSLMGLPIELDDSLPTGLIQLKWQGAVLYEIQNLAVPLDF